MLASAVAALVLPVAASAATPTNAYYSPKTAAPQSKSPAAMQTYLSTPQPGFGLQSYCFFGSLVPSKGPTDTFSMLVQGSNDIVPSIPQLSYSLEGVTFNGGDGVVFGGIQGVPELTYPLSTTQYPWSARGQSVTLGAEPQFVDARVVEGQIGQKGAIYEFTANVTGENTATGQSSPFTVYVRAKDTTGLVQWGYGPSGFFPQWLYPNQRKAVSKTYHGSVADYLSGTKDPMDGQGDYYYSAPLLSVQQFVVTQAGTTVSRGTKGTLWFDNVTQSFDAQADAVVNHGVTWTEFSAQVPSSGQAFKIGEVFQASVGSLPYAIEMAATGKKARDGALLPTKRWPIGDITISADPKSAWKSPKSGATYDLRYTVKLRGSTKGSLTLTALSDDQELVLSSRAVYEGLFKLSGTIGGKAVAGQAWGEIQPAGKL